MSTTPSRDWPRGQGGVGGRVLSEEFETHIYNVLFCDVRIKENYGSKIDSVVT